MASCSCTTPSRAIACSTSTVLRSPPPSAVGKSEDTFTTLGCFGNVGFKEMQATPVVQADLFMTLSYCDTVDGDNVHLIKDDNCNDAIPEDTRVLLVKKDACLRLQTLTEISGFQNLERIGFAYGCLSLLQSLTLTSECDGSC